MLREQCVVEIRMQMVPLELLPVMSKNPFSLQGLGIMNVIALLLTLMLPTPSARGQKGLLHVYMRSC